jgi:hypothetical protein
VNVASILAAINLGEPGATGALAGYALTLGVMGVYTARLLAKGRRLSRRVPDQDKPWT